MVKEKSKSIHSTTSVRPRRQLVLFDFDGTITTKDTLAEFMIFRQGKLRYWLGIAILSPIIILYKLKFMKNWKAKQYFLAWFFRDDNAAAINRAGEAFAAKAIPKLVRPGASAAIRQYQQQGATIAVVTASAENWVKPWCDAQGILCLGTRLEEKNNRFTGRLLGKNCYGEEKVCRIKERFDLSQFDHIIAYGDTSGDREMLAMANEQYYKPFRK